MSDDHQRELAAFRRRAEQRILLVEDNPVNQMVTQHQLLALGYPVDVVDNGHAALAALAKEGYDLVLMDCQMPEIDGYETTRRIRRLDGPAARLPVVALTAHGSSEDRERCLASGMDDYLMKPFEKEQLGAILDGFLLAALFPAEPADDPPEPALREEEEEDGAAVDLDALTPLRAISRRGADDILGQLVNGLLDQEPLTQLERLIADGDGEGVAALAHGLKGSLGFLGARPLAARYGELERTARDGELEVCARQLERLAPEHRRVEETLRAALAESSST